MFWKFPLLPLPGPELKCEASGGLSSGGGGGACEYEKLFGGGYARI